MGNIEDKVKNLQEWKDERERIKPFIDIAIDFHNKAALEAHRKNYENAANLYRQAIENYRNIFLQNPKYYLKELLERIDDVIHGYVNNAFNLRISGDRLKKEETINGFMDFFENLTFEDKKYIDSYDIALAYLRIADFYQERKNLEKSYEFYWKVVDIQCLRPFINRDAHFKIGKILFGEKRFKEALVSFVSVLSFDRDSREVVRYIEDCLKKLGILDYRDKFLVATPNEAKKLIMEVL